MFISYMDNIYDTSTHLISQNYMITDDVYLSWQIQ